MSDKTNALKESRNIKETFSNIVMVQEIQLQILLIKQKELLLNPKIL
nr:hypothetical protein [Clostridium sp. 12(A)]